MPLARTGVRQDRLRYDPASGRFMSAASFGLRGLQRSGSPIALCRNAATMEYRSSIAFSNQFAAKSISPQQVWKIAKPVRCSIGNARCEI
jgi:hypothetical protein